jgi:hypothetical protein
LSSVQEITLKSYDALVQCSTILTIKWFSSDWNFTFIQPLFRTNILHLVYRTDLDLLFLHLKSLFHICNWINWLSDLTYMSRQTCICHSLSCELSLFIYQYVFVTSAFRMRLYAMLWPRVNETFLSHLMLSFKSVKNGWSVVQMVVHWFSKPKDVSFVPRVCKILLSYKY